MISIITVLSLIGFFLFNVLGRLTLFTILSIAFSGAGILFFAIVLNIMMKG